MSKTFIIAIGQRARQGKDTVANFIKELRSTQEVHILHWADALYDEVRNADRLYPLIKRVTIGGDIYYNMLHTPYSRNYLLYKFDEIPVVHELMKIRDIDEYWGMDEKDAPMLQAWGTNFRRQKTSESYWVDKTVHKIEQLINQHELSKSNDKNLYILIPDTRFKNEYGCVKGLVPSHLKNHQHVGIFVRVVRFDSGIQYIDPSRDPKHPSEAELEETPSDFVIGANSGDLEALKQKTATFLDTIDEKW